MHVETYSEKNGWDFSKPQVRGAFLARRSLLHPDEIMKSSKSICRQCFSLFPPTTFSMDIETCYPVDTERISPMAEYKQGMKELATKFDA